MKTSNMTDPVFQRFREISWRRKLSQAEQAELRAWLLAHPASVPEWQAEARLSENLAALRDVPVPSNFTSRVLQAIKTEAGRPERDARTRWFAWRGSWTWIRNTACA